MERGASMDVYIAGLRLFTTRFRDIPSMDQERSNTCKPPTIAWCLIGIYLSFSIVFQNLLSL